MRIKILNSIICIILFASCAQRFSLQKRKYAKGFYLAHSTSRISKKGNTNHISKTEKVIENPNIIHKNSSNIEIVNNFVSSDYAPQKLTQVFSKKIPLKIFSPNKEVSNVFYNEIKNQKFDSINVKRFNEPKVNKWDTVLFVLVGFSAGLFLVISLAALTLYLSTMAGFYLMVMGVSVALSILFFLVMGNMNEL